MTLVSSGEHVGFIFKLLSFDCFRPQFPMKKPEFINLIYFQYDNTFWNSSPLFLLTINKEVLTINTNCE
ncbi:hypothetical protein PGLA_18250 [Paenibacillus glacialis]|uniref:Uncharacterized protein n=1 Tax=Paenibacillus glacialis TaxID=494026 RepID=A0A168J388_9BACL|nr:hypothetical protein PGLA_18250 [Paenibacillus glacialis]